MCWQLNGLANGVDDPAQDEFASVPTTVTLQEFLQGDGFIAVAFIGVWLGEDGIHGMEEVPAQHVHPVVATLAQLDEVIDKYIIGAQGFRERAVGWRPHFVRVDSITQGRVQCLQGGGCLHIFRLARARFPGWRQVVVGLCGFFKAVWRRVVW